MRVASQTKDKLAHALQQLDLSALQVSVEVDRGHRLVAVVTTPDFEGMDEADRQSLVWQRVYDGLDDDEQVLVDFIFTNTPAEEDEIERKESERANPQTQD